LRAGFHQGRRIAQPSLDLDLLLVGDEAVAVLGQRQYFAARLVNQFAETGLPVQPSLGDFFAARAGGFDLFGELGERDV